MSRPFLPKERRIPLEENLRPEGQSALSLVQLYRVSYDKEVLQNEESRFGALCSSVLRVQYASDILNL